MQGDLQKVKKLLKCPDVDVNEVDKDGETSLYLASMLGHHEGK